MMPTYPERIKCLSCKNVREWFDLVGTSDFSCVLFKPDQFEDFKRTLIPNDIECHFEPQK